MRNKDKNLVNKLENFLKLLLPILLIISMVFGVVKMIQKFSSKENQGKKEENQNTEYNIKESQYELRPALQDEISSEEKFEAKTDSTSDWEKISVSPKDDLEKIVLESGEEKIIFLAPGNYSANLKINKKIAIVGSGMDTRIMAKIKEKPVIEGENSEIILQNFFLADSRIGIQLENAKADVSNVKMERIEATALYVKEGEINGKNIYVYNSGSALKISDAKGKIFESIVQKNSKSGIELTNSNFEIFKNRITENGSYGIYADSTSEVNIYDNIIENNQGFNVRIEKKREIYR